MTYEMVVAAILACAVVFCWIGWLSVKRDTKRWWPYNGRRNAEISLSRYQHLLYDIERIGDNSGALAARASTAASDVAMASKNGGPALGWARFQQDAYAESAINYQRAVSSLKDRIQQAEALLSECPENT